MVVKGLVIRHRLLPHLIPVHPASYVPLPSEQRGIYPPESFARVSKYGLQMLVTSDAGLQKYLQQVLTQLSEWLYAGSVQKLVH